MQQPHGVKGDQEQSKGAQAVGLNILSCSQWKVTSEKEPREGAGAGKSSKSNQTGTGQG